MKPPARAAAVRGDDFQYAFAWYQACKVIDDPDLESISVEDRDGGSFDDVVVRRTEGLNEFFQVKTSVQASASNVVDDAWLTTSLTPTGRSPLQHFYDTYVTQTQVGRPFELTLVTNRGFDHNHRILDLRDSNSEIVDVDAVRGAGPRSEPGRQRDAWARHLEVDGERLLSFLSAVRWRQAGAESHWAEVSAPLMRLAGLRDDREAVRIGLQMVREWVKQGAGPRSRADLRQEVCEENLLARSSVLRLAVHAIDRPVSYDLPHATVDVLDQFIGDSPFARLRRTQPRPEPDPVIVRLDDAVRRLEAYPSRVLHVEGAMRHPLFFAVGRSFPRVRRWELRIDQSGGVWSTAVPPEDVACASGLVSLGDGQDLAVAIGLTMDIAAAVEEYLRSAPEIQTGNLLILGPPQGERPRPTAVPSAAWLNGWTTSAREAIVRHARHAPRVHLFIAAPAAAALFLGHAWNLLPPTEVYDFDGTYHPGVALS
ncbi:SAVED domain-containing protein [Cellulomonas sp.]|uniref:SAVED domain-containing protein n=1 Tax=Cellulomonas sp. TaxID=40001 RepID=UPI003BAA36F7